MDHIYLDNNATTRPAPEVVAAMHRCLDASWGNPSSAHAVGQAARHAVENARTQVASLLGARPREIIFTSGGTEADNLALRGLLATQPNKRHVVTTRVEHEAVLHTCAQLEREGYCVTYLDVDHEGRIQPDSVDAALGNDTALVSVMHANNETGVIFPIEQIAAMCDRRGVPLHVDAVQTAGKLPINVAGFPVSLLVISAHKMHGPKGVGAMYVRRGVRLARQVFGGHQERDIRSGTENVPGIVGLGAAAELACQLTDADRARIAGLRDRLETGLLAKIPFARVNGDRSQRTGNTTNIGFETLEAEAVVLTLSEKGICVSAGAACSSGSLEPSHVLKAMKIDPAYAHGGVRFSLSRYTTDADIDDALARIPPLLHRLHGLLPRAQPA